jgi:energy-coupling factor transport system permease protein
MRSNNFVFAAMRLTSPAIIPVRSSVTESPTAGLDDSMRYQPGQSVIHRLHPVIKLAWLLGGTVAVFAFVPSPTTWLAAVLPWAVAGGALLVLAMCGAPAWYIMGLRLWFVMALLVILTHVLGVRTGASLWGPITETGMISGLRASGRLLAVILLSALFVVTTEPFSLAGALMQVGLPYRWGFTLVTTLRLAPVFRLEAHHVYQAQLVRGVAYDASRLRRWWLMLHRLCLPLLVSALRTARNLSLSMEGRAFGLHARRTWVHGLAFRPPDIVAGALLIVLLASGVWLRFTG